MYSVHYRAILHYLYIIDFRTGREGCPSGPPASEPFPVGASRRKMLRLCREAPARTFPEVGWRAAGSLRAALYPSETAADGRAGGSRPPTRGSFRAS